MPSSKKTNPPKIKPPKSKKQSPKEPLKTTSDAICDFHGPIC